MTSYFCPQSFHQTAVTRRIQGPARVIEEARPYADENIFETDSLKGEFLSSPLIEFSTVLLATNNFNDKLGAGGFGPVYKVGSFKLFILF
jgi:hypothetical protein